MDNLFKKFGHESSEEKTVDGIETEIQGDTVVWRKMYSDGSVESTWNTLDSSPSDSGAVRSEVKRLKEELGLEDKELAA